VRSRNRRLARERFEREMNAESSMAQKESISSLRQRSIVNIEVAARLVICGQPDKSRDMMAGHNCDRDITGPSVSWMISLILTYSKFRLGAVGV
jgi:hypothetical protein